MHLVRLIFVPLVAVLCASECDEAFCADADPGCCCQGDARYPLVCTVDGWACENGMAWHTTAQCEDPCGACMWPGGVCCDESGAVVGQLSCLMVCEPAGTADNCLSVLDAGTTDGGINSDAGQ